MPHLSSPSQASLVDAHTPPRYYKQREMEVSIEEEEDALSDNVARISRAIAKGQDQVEIVYKAETKASVYEFLSALGYDMSNNTMWCQGGIFVEYVKFTKPLDNLLRDLRDSVAAAVTKNKDKTTTKKLFSLAFGSASIHPLMATAHTAPEAYTASRTSKRALHEEVCLRAISDNVKRINIAVSRGEEQVEIQFTEDTRARVYEHLSSLEYKVGSAAKNTTWCQGGVWMEYVKFEPWDAAAHSLTSQDDIITSSAQAAAAQMFAAGDATQPATFTSSVAFAASRTSRYELRQNFEENITLIARALAHQEYKVTIHYYAQNKAAIHIQIPRGARIRHGKL